jgi:hypothetical protein
MKAVGQRGTCRRDRGNRDAPGLLGGRLILRHFVFLPSRLLFERERSFMAWELDFFEPPDLISGRINREFKLHFLGFKNIPVMHRDMNG